MRGSPGRASQGSRWRPLGCCSWSSKDDPRDAAGGRFGAPGDVLISALGAQLGGVLGALARRSARHPATRMMFYVMTIGWLLRRCCSSPGPGFSEIARITPPGLGALVFLGIACSGLAYIAWYDALQHMPASQVGALLYLEPLVAMTVAAIVLWESRSCPTVVGGAVILVGVWLVNRRPGEPGTPRRRWR